MDGAHAKVLADREKLVAFHKRVEDQIVESSQKEQEQARHLQGGQRELALLEEARDRLQGEVDAKERVASQIRERDARSQARERAVEERARKVELDRAHLSDERQRVEAEQQKVQRREADLAEQLDGLAGDARPWTRRSATPRRGYGPGSSRSPTKRFGSGRRSGTAARA